ncbi:MAG TPA: LysR substrate-binding domain-containing protein [Burkholderiaceae bacterium]|nr:LysR substrate-binding domain-containing protein [Burkholderiaceae bacterium]
MRQYDLPPLAQLEAFEASARHLSFTKAADELALTQSAVSRQIAALEAHYGLALFRRLHRALRLTEDGQTLAQAVAEVLGRLHQVGGELKPERRPKTVVVTTTPGFAGLWLIPRLAGFTAAHPDVDVRISAAYALTNLNRDGVDLAIRYQSEPSVGEGAELVFGEVVLPVCSPRLRRDPARPLKRLGDLRHHVLLHLDSGPGADMQDWPIWLRAMKLEGLEPARMLHFSQFDQLINAAIAGQGVALGRMPLLQRLLRERKLVAPFDKTMASPRGYYLVRSAAASRKPEVLEFAAWLRGEARNAR